MGNSQEGNNNAYCQDNRISWLDWRLLETNRDIFEFVKGLIAFRKKHGVFHMEREPRIMDYRSCGRPDVSYHGEYVWRPEFENFRRQLGILYWGNMGRRRTEARTIPCMYFITCTGSPMYSVFPTFPKGPDLACALRYVKGPGKGRVRRDCRRRS